MKRMRRKGDFFTSAVGRIVAIFVALLIPLYAILVISTISYLHSLQEIALNSAQSFLDVNLVGVSAEMKRVDRFFFQLQEEDADFQRLTQFSGSSEDQLSFYSVYHKLVNQNNFSSFSEVLFLYLEQTEQCVLAEKSIGASAHNLLQKELGAADLVKGPARWQVLMMGGTPYLAHTVGYSGVYIGSLIDLNEVMGSIRTQIPYEQTSVWLQGNETEHRPDLVICSAEIDDTGSQMCVGLDRSEIISSMPVSGRLMLILGFVLVIVFPVLLIYLIVRMIDRPTKKIVEGMYHLAEGESDYRIPEFQASVEFTGMRNSFNNMASEIQHLKIQQYEEALEREQMLLQNLLLQIRPHFLLNFFNQIFSMAELKDYAGIKRSCLFLSRFFRYLFRQERIATLQSELELVDLYLELMAERFVDCFTVERNIDPKLLQYRVPPLIVQNFVENIFKHAISDSNIITIELRLRKENGFVVMSIRDDGPGMDEETLQKIRESRPIEKQDGTHIGIYNSAYRLKKLCGEECRLEVDSVLTEGTEIRIMLPEKRDIG